MTRIAPPTLARRWRPRAPLTLTIAVAGLATVLHGVQLFERVVPPGTAGQARLEGPIASAYAEEPKPPATSAGVRTAMREPLASGSVAARPGERGGAPPGATPDPKTFGMLADLAISLAERERGIERREAALALREQALQAVETRIEQRLTQLEGYRTEVAQLIQQVSAEDAAKLAQLVKVYETMKAKEAAAVFDGMDRAVILKLAKRMREPKLSAIFGQMEPARARDITTELAMTTPVPPTP